MIIRFLPDTWREAILRPLAMAAPDGNVYVEIMAPDFRFVFLCILVLVWLAWPRQGAVRSPATFRLLAIVMVLFIPWLVTTGNGRYFIPVLLAVGPLCLALVHGLPWTRVARLLLAAGLIGIQAAVLVDSSPFQAWSLGRWREAPYFQISLSERFRNEPATYVTITSISYSLIAPLFHPRSHWMNISSMLEDAGVSIETRKAREILAGSKKIYIVVPTMPAHMATDGTPNAELKNVINDRLRGQRLALSGRCELASSVGLANVVLRNPAQAKLDTLAKLGFWICPLQYPVVTPRALDRFTEFDMVFQKIEDACPRFFPAGQAQTMKTGDWFVRDYSATDMKLYISDDGKIYYKYWRALNPVLMGNIAEVTGGLQIHCDQIRGRSGLPWERRL
ncbi:MAG: glycosyltransferase family 87 protein [Ramlibacter sp.]